MQIMKRRNVATIGMGVFLLVMIIPTVTNLVPVAASDPLPIERDIIKDIVNSRLYQKDYCTYDKSHTRRSNWINVIAYGTESEFWSALRAKNWQKAPYSGVINKDNWLRIKSGSSYAWEKQDFHIWHQKNLYEWYHGRVWVLDEGSKDILLVQMHITKLISGHNGISIHAFGWYENAEYHLAENLYDSRFFNAATESYQLPYWDYGSGVPQWGNSPNPEDNSNSQFQSRAATFVTEISDGGSGGGGGDNPIPVPVI